MSFGGLGPDARALLDAAEGGDDPSAADAARVRRRLAAQLALGAAAGLTAATVTKTAGGATAATAAGTTSAAVGAGAVAGGAAGAALGAGAGVGTAAVPMTSLLTAKVLVAVALVGGATATGAVVMHERAPVTMVSAAPSQPAPQDHRAIPTVAEVMGSAPTPLAPHSREPVADPTTGPNTVAMNGAPVVTDPTTTTGANTPIAGRNVTPALHAGRTGSGPASPSNVGANATSPKNGATDRASASSRSGPPTGGTAGAHPTIASGNANANANAGTTTNGSTSAPSGSTPGGSNAGSSAGASAPPTDPAQPAGGGPAPARPPRDTVAEEAALLRAANAALARGDGATALARLDEHASRFPRGALTEEREAARVLALCTAGRAAESRAAASKFVSANPRSPFVAQVRRACSTQ